MYKSIVSFIITILLTNYCCANSSVLRADTMLYGIEKMKISDKAKAEKYMSFAEHNKISKPYLSITSLGYALDIYQNNGEDVKAAQANTAIADIYSQVGFYIMSAEYYFKAYQAFIKNNNDTCVAWLFINIGNIFFNLERFDRATVMYQKAGQYFTKSKYLFGISVVYLNYGLIKEKQSKNDSALYYFNLSLKEREKNNDKYDIAHIYSYIARIHIKESDFRSAQKYLNNSCKLLFDLPDKIDLHFQQISSNFLLFAQLYEKQHDFRNAYLYADSAMYFAKKISDTVNVINTNIYIAELYEKQNIPLKAADYYKKALDLSNKSAQIDFQSNILIKLLKTYFHLGNEKMAEMYLDKYEQLLRIIKVNNNKNKYETLMLALETFNKKNEIEIYKENNLTNIFLIRFLILFLVFILVFIIVVYYFNNRLWKRNRELIDTAAQIHLFKTIVEQNFSSIVIADIKGNIEYVNPSFTKMTGYSFDEAIGKNPRILKSDYHDNDFYINLWNSITNGNAWNGIFKNVNKNGDYFWEEATITPIKDKNGTIIKFAAVKQDITQRKQMEEDIELFNEQFKKIFDSIDDFVFVIDFETEKIISANLKTKLTFGDVEQKHLYDFIFDEDKQHFLNIPKDLLLKEELKPLSEREIIKEEVFLKSKDSWYDFNMRTITWINKTKAILIVANDITERKNKILILNELNASKDKFFSIISHDLKSPFQGLLGFANLLLNNVDNYDIDTIKMVVKNIYDASKTSYNLLENLLEWATLQKGITNIDKKQFNLHSVLLQTIELLQPFSLQKNITIKFLVPKTLTVFSDVHILSTVLRNLLNNAIKFTPLNGEIIITAEENIDEVVISVKDNGIGIPREMIPKLFSIETKFSVVGTAGEKGNALGLILCKELIEKNGGRIYAESKLDEGSTFYFTVDNAKTIM